MFEIKGSFQFNYCNSTDGYLPIQSIVQKRPTISLLLSRPTRVLRKLARKFLINKGVNASHGFRTSLQLFPSLLHLRIFTKISLKFLFRNVSLARIEITSREGEGGSIEFTPTIKKVRAHVRAYFLRPNCAITRIG